MSYASAHVMTDAPNLATSVSVPEYADPIEAMIHQFIVRKYKPLRHAAKILATHACIDSVQTASAWLYGRRHPRGMPLAHLCARNKDLYAEFKTLIEQLSSQIGE